MALDSHTNSTLRSETAEIPQQGFSSIRNKKMQANGWDARWLRNTQWASLFVNVDLISFCHYCYEKFQ